MLLRAEQLDPALLRQKQEELVARGHSPEEVAAYWRALTGGVAQGTGMMRPGMCSGEQGSSIRNLRMSKMLRLATGSPCQRCERNGRF